MVVGGAGRAFCSGMDRTAMAAGTIGEAFYRHWIRALNCLEDMPKVSVGVLHGYSIGGGLQLGLACDVRLATDDAVLGLGASRHGIIPDGGVLRLARVVGLGRAKELALFNDDVTPGRRPGHGAGELGVRRRPRWTRRWRASLERLRHQAPTANAHIKRLLHESFHRDPRASIEDVMAAQRDCMASWEDRRGQPRLAGEREAMFHPRPTA